MTGQERQNVKAEKKVLDTRLASIEGHIKGIRKMVDDEAYCVDVLKQTYAVERALQKFEAELLRGHLCWLIDVITDGALRFPT